MADATTVHSRQGKTRTDSDPDRVLLFFPFRRLPEPADDMLERLSAASGIGAGDLRYKLVGQGLTRLTPNPSPDRQHECIAQMQDMGIPAALVPAAKIRRRFKLPVARKVRITEEAVVFYDRQGNAVLTVEGGTDLLVILADISGEALENPQMAIHFGQTPQQKTFDEALKKISVAEPVAAFCKPGQEAPRAVLLDHAAFAYPSMGKHMSMSASVNFRTLVTRTMERANSVVTDHLFGTAQLAGARPDWQGSRTDVIATFNRYVRFLMAAAGAGLLKPGADPHAKAPDVQDTGAKSAGRTVSPAAEATERQADKPLPPPQVQRSGVIGRLLGLPYETIHLALFAAALLGWFWINTGDFDHPLFWKAAAGICLVGAGLLVFPYSLVLLHYKRMVSNTPTSRVRSVAMGLAELEGRARQFYDLRSTHSNTRCIYYRCMYYRKVRTSDGNRWRLEKITDSGKLPFYLEDDTGRVLIRPKGALVLAEKVRQEFWGGQNMWLSPKLQNRDMRIYEDIIAEGARIYVLGAAGTERVGRTFKQRMISRLRDLKSNPQKLMQYDANSDGRIDETEWETARAEMETMVHAETLAEGTGPAERVVVKKPGYGLLPFIVANTEALIIGKLALRVWLFLAGGLAMIALGTQLLVRLWAA